MAQGVVSLELLTVFFDGPVALYICYLISKGSPKANFWMIVLATAELYGGKMLKYKNLRVCVICFVC